MNYFSKPLDQLCGKNKIIDQFHYIYFQNGFVYVSNGTVHLKQRMELYEFSETSIKVLEGFCIHKDAYKLLKSLNKTTIGFSFKSNTPIVCYTINNSIGSISIPKTKDVPGKGSIIKQIDKICDSFEMEPIKEITFMPEAISLIKKMFVKKSSGFTFRFNSNRILVAPNENSYQEHAIIAPLLIKGTLNKKL